MNTQDQFVSDWSSSPSASIIGLLKQSGKTLEDLTSCVGDRILDVVSNGASFDGELAEALANHLGGSVRFWLRRDEIFQQQKSLPKLPDENDWVRSLPYAEMARLGWLPATRSMDEKVDNSLDFFDCDNLREWQLRYESTISKVAFRTSYAFENDITATLAWLRRGEQIALSRKIEDFHPDRLLARIPELKSLCRKAKPTEFLPRLTDLLAEAGVGFAVVRAPKGCRASGATRINNENKAILQLSFRYLSDDHFWFTLFHEVGHLVLHRETQMFLEGSFVDNDKFEVEANSFAANTLISNDSRDLLRRVTISAKSLIQLSYKLGVSPGILVGQMQHEKIISPSQMNFLKRRYQWA